MHERFQEHIFHTPIDYASGWDSHLGHAFSPFVGVCKYYTQTIQAAQNSFRFQSPSFCHNGPVTKFYRKFI